MLIQVITCSDESLVGSDIIDCNGFAPTFRRNCTRRYKTQKTTIYIHTCQASVRFHTDPHRDLTNTRIFSPFLNT